MPGGSQLARVPSPTPSLPEAQQSGDDRSRPGVIERGGSLFPQRLPMLAGAERAQVNGLVDVIAQPRSACQPS